MFIKAAIVSKDMGYVLPVMRGLNQNYGNQLQIFSFSDINNLEKEIQFNHIDIVLIDQLMDIGLDCLMRIPVTIAWLTEQAEIKTLQNYPAIAKYQSMESLYQAIIGLYADNNSVSLVGKGDYRFITICNASGGSGVTSVALGYARRMAVEGNKVLYFNMETLNVFSPFLSSEKIGGMSQALYCLHKDSTIGLKLESLVTKDPAGFYYFTECESIFDLHDVEAEKFVNLIEELAIAGNYNYIILDLTFDFTDRCWKLLEASDRISILSNGTEIGNKKTLRLIDTIEEWDMLKSASILSKTVLIYNKFRSKTGKVLEDSRVETIGAVPMIENGDEKKIIEQISKMEMLDDL